MSIVRAVLKFEGDAVERIFEKDRLFLGKSIPVETELKASFTADDGEPVAQTVTWNDAQGFAQLLQYASIGVETKNGIVAYNRSRSAKGASKSQVDFARVPPRS